MEEGLDYVTGPPVASLKAAGITFVCRYLSEENDLTKVKLLTLDEAKTLGAAGIAVVSNYEWTGTTPLGGKNAGIYDAQIAQDQHAACGGPANRPIYFSVDFGATAAQMPVIIDYFKQGVASVIGLNRTGAYGSYEVIKALFDAGAITWGWQTYAWSNGEWEPRAHIRQYENGVIMDKLEVDRDRATVSDFGQWLPGGIEMLTIADPWVQVFFKQTATGPDRWHCASTGFDLFAGILEGWCKMNGAPRLPTGPEVKCGNKAVYQECESGIILWDPDHEFDGPRGPWEPCYLLKLGSALAKKLLNIGQNIPDAVGAITQAHAAYGALAEVIKDLGGTP